jgi:tetratricopeptide (TPR) repeat protein
MSQNLALALYYLTDLDHELTRATDNDPRTRTAARETMRSNLDYALALVSRVEETEPHATCLDPELKHEVDVLDVRIRCHTIQARIMSVCYDDFTTAAEWMHRAVALDPSRAYNHAFLALFLSAAHNHEAAMAAAKRAISLMPDDLELRKIYDDIGRSAIPTPDATPDYPWWHVGKYLS